MLVWTENICLPVDAELYLALMESTGRTVDLENDLPRKGEGASAGRPYCDGALSSYIQAAW